jgi:hypothetical protein
MTRRLVLATVLLTVASLSAQAQTVKVEFLMGKVNLVAQNASLRAILNEWSRVGGTRLVNPERLSGGPVTLEFVGVPERQALDILLRDVGGYILGPRTTLVTGVSAFDRLVVVAAAAGRPQPVLAGRGVPPPRPSPQLGRVVAPIEREPVVDDAIDADDPEPDETERAPRARTVPPTPGLPPLPQTFEQPATEPPRTTPGNPFGAVQGTARPGMITAPPSTNRDVQQPQEAQPPN